MINLNVKYLDDAYIASAVQRVRIFFSSPVEVTNNVLIIVGGQVVSRPYSVCRGM